MSQPEVPPTAQDLYRRLGDGFRRGDEASGWLLLNLCSALGLPFETVNELADSDWTLAMDPDTAPDVAWLGQHVGVQYDARHSLEHNRQRVRDRRQWRRGTLEAIRAAAAETLVEGARVDIFERDGGAYKITVITSASQTPDENATRAALLRAIPVGHTLTYAMTDAFTYLQLAAAVEDYDELAASYDDYNDLRGNILAGTSPTRVVKTVSTTWNTNARAVKTVSTTWNVVAEGLVWSEDFDTLDLASVGNPNGLWRPNDESHDISLGYAPYGQAGSTWFVNPNQSLGGALRSNSTVAGGVLSLSAGATPPAWAASIAAANGGVTPPKVGAILVSNSAVRVFGYGYYEFRAALPTPGKGMFPTIWFAATEARNPGKNKGNTEVDIMAVFGYPTGRPYNVVINPVDDAGITQPPGYQDVATVDSDTTSMHTYGVDWTSEYMAFYKDDVLVAQATPATAAWLAGLSLEIRLSLGVDPSFFPASRLSDASTPPLSMQVEYIRQYASKPGVVAPPPPPTSARGMPRKAVAIYWPYYATVERLVDIDQGVGIINLFNTDPVGGPPGSTGAMFFDRATMAVNNPAAEANLNADIVTCRNRLQRIVLTIGGAGAQVRLDTRTRSQAFVDSVYAMIDNLGGAIDGLDLNNYEGAQSLYTSEWIWACQQIKNRYGSDFFFSSPPSATHFESQADRDAPHLKAMSDAGVMDFITPQFYDGGGLNVTAHIIDMIGFYISQGIPVTKMGVGYGINSANSTWWPSASAVLTSWNTVFASYSGLRGAMNFSKPQDPTDQFAIVVGPTILASNP